MIDIRDRDGSPACVTRSNGSRTALPSRMRPEELLDELVDALAESGPLELDVTEAAWLSSIRSAESGVAAADGGSSPTSVRRAEQSIGELKRFFGGTDDGTRADWIVLPFLLLLLLVALFLAICMSPLLLLVVLIKGFKQRYVGDVREAATGLELPDRLLFAHTVNAARSEVSSAVRARLGAYVHPVLIATDRRLALAQPPTLLPRRSGRFAVVWEVPYSRIRAFSTRTGFSRELVTIQTSEREITFKLPSVEGYALVAILKRRAPEAFTDSVASSAEVAVAAS
jgi:hypothetical protein